ncbi:MAG: Mg/Co/Ni transporter MgtE, CBS domain-containing [uncultured Nocardioidaceae bacterium]|uniref:Mg/Co/Ni transporter MgtE, CBS domain-containing n=1 Tax=uncultured Nocardioidaceae bacterium TaxID=253824 RepID=A0A6J4NG04_9ACTN|nr:MAG: Mg/Co/Ni transporter MgtE, CBS domain-containing [uncultured Nocardioidaceae bacterium]
MTSSPNRVFVGRLAGLQVFDPAGDQVGRVRDLVALMRPEGQPPRVLGLVVEVFGRRTVFLPMTRVTSIDSGQVITTGVVNMRRFEQRPNETLVVGEMLDRIVKVRETGTEGTVYDLAIEQERNRDWVVSRVAIQEGAKRFGRKGQTHIVEWWEIDGFDIQQSQGATHLLAALDEMKPADLATVIHDLPSKRRSEIAAALDDERLADVLEELPEEDQVEILGQLDDQRAADVLEEMSPDDAADLIGDLPPETAETLLQLMQPEEAEDVRRLLSYEERTAGGMMTTEPVILPPDATVADALAHVRNEELVPSLAAMVYVTRPPLEPPTGRLIGVAHIQRLLREPPSTLLGAMLEGDVDSIKASATLEEVARHLATYNLVAAPVLDDNGRLLGAVTVDDLLDHLLPENWRDRPRGISGRLRA